MLRFVSIVCLSFVLTACQREEGRAPDSLPSPPDMTQIQPPAPLAAPSMEAPEGSRLPLRRILDIVERVSPGEVIEVELDEDDGVEVYEVKTLTPEGRAIETTVHARTGQVLDREED